MAGIRRRQRVKKPRNKVIMRGILKNDLEYVDKVSLREKIHDQSRFSVLYFTLLISSVLVCTLGLLTNSSAIVIGGMLIAPLMWPLARLGFGIAHRLPQPLTRGGLLLLASIVIGALSAYLITFISPIKVINDEILARTAPTLMDLFIALAAGFVAAIAITQKKIADSLAGVAIAVSLMPPLCTVGIALALKNIPYSFGALLLFAVNAACITLVTTVVFILTQYARKERVHVATRAMAVNLVFVLLLAVPLVQFLRTYSFELQSYGLISEHMNDFINRKDPAALFENVRVEQTDRDTLSVAADLLIPTDIAFTYEDNEALVAELERIIDKKILLNLRIQGIIEPISKDQRDTEEQIDAIRTALATELTKLDSTYRINTSSVTQAENGWIVSVDVLSSPEAVPTTTTVSDLSDTLTAQIGEPVQLQVTFLPRLTLRSDEQTTASEVQKAIENVTLRASRNAVISNFVVSEQTVSYIITTSNPESFNETYLDRVRDEAEEIMNTNANLQVRIVEATDIES